MNPPTEISIAAFIKRHSAVHRRDTREHLLGIVAWYWRDQRLGVLRNQGKIIAVALVRALTDLKQAETPYHHDERGQILWIDDIISRAPCGIAFLLDLARQRFGQREAFAGHVFKRRSELRLLPWATVARLAQHT
jgi:hypothetical protein